MSDRTLIAVVGATGARGGGLVRAILDDPSGGFELGALTRDPDSDGVLRFVLPMGDAKLPGIAGEHLSGREMADALRAALGERVEHVAMDPADYRALGFPGAEDLGNMFQFKRDFEDAYRASRSVETAHRLNPALQSFGDWLDAHASEIPIE